MKIGILGLGLIGGSMARALKTKTDHVVYAFDRNPSAMLKGELLQAYDFELTEENVGDIDVFVIALYPEATCAALRKYAPQLKDGAIVFDCVGNKGKVVGEMRRLATEYPMLSFVGVHPMAGREFSGIAHSTAGLFEKATAIMVPVETPITALVKVKKLLLEVGFEGVVVTDSDEHDKIIAYTSQLAHIVSSAYIKNPLSAVHYGYSAGSFRDMTRVAKLNPDMWAELMLDNGDNLLSGLNELMARLTEYKTAIETRNEAELRRLLAEGNEQKEKVESLRQRKLADSLDKALK